MTYIDAKILMETALTNDVLHYAITNLCEQSNPQYVAVYYSEGPNGGPEGWYAVPFEDFIHDLMDDEEGQKALINALKERGVEIKWFDWCGFDKTMAALTGVAAN